MKNLSVKVFTRNELNRIPCLMGKIETVEIWSDDDSGKIDIVRSTAKDSGGEKMTSGLNNTQACQSLLEAMAVLNQFVIPAFFENDDITFRHTSNTDDEALAVMLSKEGLETWEEQNNKFNSHVITPEGELHEGTDWMKSNDVDEWIDTLAEALDLEAR